MSTTPSLPSAYWRQWTASVISNLGDGIEVAAMPLLALSLTGDTRLLSLTAFANFLPWLLLALPAGVLVDRRDRRNLMIGANLVRAGLYTVVAIGAAAGWLSIWSLIGLIFLIGCFEVVFDSSAQAILPSIVQPEQLARANGLLGVGEIVAGGIAGLPLGALLFAATVSAPFAIDAASFAIAAALIATIRIRRVPAPVGEHGDDGRLTTGLRWLLGHRVLRPLAVAYGLVTFGLALSQGIFVKYAVDELGVSRWAYGLLLAISAMGAATGGLLGARLIARLGLGGGVVLPYWLLIVGNVLYGVLDSIWQIGVVSFVTGFSIAVWNVATITTRQQLAPSEMLGRVNSAYRWMGSVATVIGIVTGGLIAHAWTLRTPFLVAAAATALVGVLFTPRLVRELAPR